MRYLWLMFACMACAASVGATEKKIGAARVHFTGELKGNDLHMTEEHALDLTEAWQHPSRTYYRSFLAGRFPVVAGPHRFSRERRWPANEN